MKKYIIIQFIMAVGLLGGCTEEFDNPPLTPPVTDLVPNMTLAQLNTLPPKTLVDDGVIVWGKVISTDQYGNFYKSLFIEDGTGGVELKVGKSTLYNTYHLGDTIFVKAAHLAYGNYSLGAPNPDPTSYYVNTYIEVQLWINMTVFRGAQGVLVPPTVINDYSQINANSYATLVTLKNMTFTPLSSDKLDTWAIQGATTPGGNAQEHTFTFPDNTKTIVVRTSNFADFAAEKVPAAGSKVDLTGILTVFNGKNQFVLNSLAGVKVL